MFSDPAKVVSSKLKVENTILPPNPALSKSVFRALFLILVLPLVFSYILFV